MKKNGTSKLTLGILFFFMQFSISVSSQETKFRKDAGLPPLWVELVSKDKKNDKTFFRLHNNTVWNVLVSTTQLYYLTKTPIKLFNGVSTYAMPNDQEVSINFELWQTKTISSKSCNILFRPAPNGGFKSWIASGDSVIFSISEKEIKKTSFVSIKFKYEWEVNKKSSDQDIIDQKVLFYFSN